MPVGEDLLDVGADLAADRCAGGEERVVGGRGAVVVEPQDDAGEVGVVRLWAAELVVGHGRPGAGGRRAARQVLQLAAPADVADEDVQLAVMAEADDPAVVVAALGLAGILLDRPQPDQVLVEASGSTRSRRSGRLGCRAAASR